MIVGWFPNATYRNSLMNCQRCGCAAKIAHSELNELLKSARDPTKFTLELQNLELFKHRLQCRLDKAP
jgi:Fe2+ or Zn2+ uptake regulation protein